MKNFFYRFILVIIAIPSLYALVVFLPQFGHAAIVIVAVIFSAGCGVEMGRLFASRNLRTNIFVSSLFAALPPALIWAGFRIFPASPGDAWTFFLLGISLAALAAFSPFAFPKDPARIPGILGEASARSFPLLYPGLFSVALVLIAGYPRNPSDAMLWFALLVFGNDSAAWAVGILFGRHRGVIAISPNKSLEGFLGGFAGSIGLSLLGPVIFPNAASGSPFRLVLLGTVVGLAVILGDLFESALKRSAGFKDSGKTIPGRGGFLDSFDSVLFAAPVYYAAIRLLGLI